MVELSVVIPTFNRASRLRTCLEALAHQTQPAEDFEVVVVVDGSTDDTRQMLSELKLPFLLRVIEQPNQGQCAARNHGAQVASGRTLLFLDDDIIPGPDLISTHLAAHQEHSGIVGIGSLRMSIPTKADWFVRGFAQ